jgi:hypothetical protein
VEYLPAEFSEFLSAGKSDLHNRYPSAAMLTTDGVWGGATCSAVLLGPRIALTAGSCVCAPKKGGSSEQGRTFIDAASCAERTHVTTVVYGDIVDELHAEMEFLSHIGDVYPHPDLRIVMDSQGNVIANHADLALIVLRTPAPSRFVSATLAESEVHPQEELTMTGFGNDARFGQMVGIRYFRKNKVVSVPEDGRVLYAQQGAYLYSGFAGGPCFRESERDRWLVGVASIGTEKELVFTSTFFYRDWIRSETIRLLELASPLPP